MRTRSLLLAAFATLGCATARPTATAKPSETATTTAAPRATSAMAPGLAAAEVRRRLGDPKLVLRVPSSVAGGATYERWRYPDREVILLDGKVIDVIQ